MNLTIRLELLKRETCEDYDRGHCLFYNGDCFHTIGNRCYRLIPRKEDELMEWMNDICSNCNEPVCNDCDVYKDYYQKS